MKTCPKCGNVIHDDNVRFCKKCGADLYVNPGGGIWLGGGDTDDTGNDNKKKNVVVIGIAVIVVVVLLLSVVFALSGSDGDDEIVPSDTVKVDGPAESVTGDSSEELVTDDSSEENSTAHGSSDMYSETAKSDADSKKETKKDTNPEKKVVEKEKTPEKKAEPAKETPKEDTKKEPTQDTQSKRLSTALAKGDYKQVQVLANEGYAPAYVPLAKYYLSNHEYDDADRYAKKAKAAGQSGGQSIITTLENLGYYD